MGQAFSDTAIDLSHRLDAFITERFPFALGIVRDAFHACAGLAQPDEASLEALRRVFGPELGTRLDALAPSEGVETTPGVDGRQRFRHAIDELVDACDGFLRRAALRASLTPDERREILRGMVLTRATDNRLKTLFTGGEVRYGETAFQGKGFRSLGQEAIYGAGIRLRRGGAFREVGEWRGDVIAPLIRDLGVILAMRPTPESVRQALSAQMAKAGPPMDGKDIHVGDMGWGILPPAAPLTIGTLTLAGMALGVRARWKRTRSALVHRRWRDVARRVARGDQSVRGTPAACHLLRREQPDGALDAVAGSIRRPRVRR